MLSNILDLQCRYYVVVTYYDIKFHDITVPIRICGLDYGNSKVCTGSRDSLLMYKISSWRTGKSCCRCEPNRCT